MGECFVHRCPHVHRQRCRALQDFLFFYLRQQRQSLNCKETKSNTRKQGWMMVREEREAERQTQDNRGKKIFRRMDMHVFYLALTTLHACTSSTEAKEKRMALLVCSDCAWLFVVGRSRTQGRKTKKKARCVHEQARVHAMCTIDGGVFFFSFLLIPSKLSHQKNVLVYSAHALL